MSVRKAALRFTRANPSLTARRALLAALAAQLAVSVSEQGIPTLAGFVKQNLAVSAAVSGLIVSSILVGEVVASYGAGALADRIGARAVMSLSTIAAGGLIIIASALPTVGLVLALVGAGVFIAAVTPAGGRLILTSSSRRRLGTSMGIRQSGVPLGGFAAAVLLPAVAASSSWRAAVTVAGSLTLVGGIVALGFSGLESTTSPTTAADAQPAIARRRRSLALATAWACLLVSCQYVIIAFLGLSLHATVGLTLAQAGLFVAIAQLGGILGRIGWGYIADRLLHGEAKRLLLSLSGVAFLVALALALLPGRQTSVVVFAALAFVAGLTVLGWQGVWIMFVSELDGAPRAGRSIGFALTFVNLAGFVSAPLFGLVIDASHSFKAMWLAAAAVLATSFIPLGLVRHARD